MPFSRLGFRTADYMFNPSMGAGSSLGRHFYVTTDDAATVEAVGYFDAIAKQLKIGDHIDVTLNMGGVPERREYGVAQVAGGVILSKGGGGDPDRLMFFASRTRAVSGYAIDTTSIALTYFASKLKFGNAPYKTRGFRLHFSGFAMNEGFGPQETVFPGNDVVIDGVDIVIGGVAYPADFSGSPGVTIASGTKGAWCDFPTAPDLDAEADFIVITRWHVAAVGNKFVGGSRIQKHRGEKYWAAADGAALASLISGDAATTAVLDNYYAVPPGNQTNSQILCFGPDFMVAKGDWDGRPVVLCTGDSIGYGRQEVSASADARGNLGWESKWLDIDDPTYGRIPHMFIGCPSAQSARELATDAFLRWDIIDEVKAFNGGSKLPFTIVLNQMGTNDSNATISTWKSRMTGVISRIKARVGGKVVQCTIPPQNSTTGSFFTTEVISVAAIWTNAGGRGSINGDIRANNAFGHDGFIDVDVAWVDPDNPDKFRPASAMGQIGTVISVTPGDGSTTHPTGVIDWQAEVGDNILAEYQPGLYAARVITDLSPVGDGTFNVVFAHYYATVFQANAKAYWAISPEGVHPFQGYVDHWVVPRLPQSEKAKLAA